jgi:tRNA G18 (ribose-2'-O)-methylase SpoU
MPISLIDNLDDERLAPYRQLRSRNPTWLSGQFIVESRWLVDRLLASDYRVESILVDENQRGVLPSTLPEDVLVLVVPASQISQLVGFDFHRGVLACGRRVPKLDYRRLFVQPLPPSWTGVLLDGVQDPENMGLIARTCAALGIGDFLIGPGCVDPYARRVLRVSMGGMLKLRKFSVPQTVEALAEFAGVGVATVATSLADGALSLETFARRGPTLVVFGNEAKGLSQEVQQTATHRLRIDMDPGTDSLNVSVAAGITLHYLTRLAHHF